MNIVAIFLVFLAIFAVASFFIFRYFLSLRFQGDRSPFFVLAFIIFCGLIIVNTFSLLNYTTAEAEATETSTFSF